MVYNQEQVIMACLRCIENLWVHKKKPDTKAEKMDLLNFQEVV